MLKILTGVLAVSVFLVGFTASPSEATPITAQFYVQIDSVWIDPVSGLDPAELASPTPPFRGVVGDKLFGSVTYDDAGIPARGAYVIGMSSWDEGGFGFTHEELYGPSMPVQEWSLEWNGLTNFGFEVPATNQFDNSPPLLMFRDGRLSGFSITYYPDINGGLREETIDGTRVEALGLYPYPSNVPQIADLPEVGIAATGTIHFLADNPSFAIPDGGSTFWFALTALTLVGALSSSVKQTLG